MEATLQNDMPVSTEQHQIHASKLTKGRIVFAAMLALVASAVLSYTVYGPRSKSTTELLRLSVLQDDFINIGMGGCSTDAEDFPQPLFGRTASTNEACADICSKDRYCKAYEWTENEKKCQTHPIQRKITKSNLYRGVVCYAKKGPIDKFKNIGAGGCSTDAEDFPHPLFGRRASTNEACAEICLQDRYCTAYEWTENEKKCQIHPISRKITKSNFYRGVVCYAKKTVFDNFENIGDGGCSTDTEPYPKPVVPRIARSNDECATICLRDRDCSAYEFAANNGQCQLHPLSRKITKSNFYPGVVCYAKK
eukprot:TRINITY_DN62_c0_g1_i4.p1 TRINITY_DN62_c0_g1~~TRINITY_DN62_c0_g1_i4.p1  ORF type:complete len:308 (-),score=31.96 TRINITY_DN62_c0_g1_i4:84-1007(-)